MSGLAYASDKTAAGKSALPPCALCLKASRLVGSHILPEFLYETMYDEKHRMVGVNVLPDHDADLLQKGLRAPLLCEACEARLQKFEDHAARVLRRLPDLSDQKPGTSVSISGGEYARFKLFQMSILWRMSVTRLGTFGAVRLGKRHEDGLRQLIWAADPGAPSKYPCLLIRPNGDGPIAEFFLQPRQAKFHGHTVYFMVLRVFGGCSSFLSRRCCYRRRWWRTSQHPRPVLLSISLPSRRPTSCEICTKSFGTAAIVTSPAH